MHKVPIFHDLVFLIYNLNPLLVAVIRANYAKLVCLVLSRRARLLLLGFLDKVNSLVIGPCCGLILPHCNLFKAGKLPPTNKTVSTNHSEGPIQVSEDQAENFRCVNINLSQLVKRVRIIDEDTLFLNGKEVVATTRVLDEVSVP